MSQKLKCPLCAGEVTLEQLIQTADLEALSKAQAAFGEDWDLAREYLDCFRPQSGKALAVKKLLRLAREVWEMWRPGRFEYSRQEYRVGREEFRGALRSVCNQVGHGLTNHNYLKKVLVSAAEKTSQREERELREREERLMAGRDARPTGNSPSPQPSPGSTGYKPVAPEGGLTPEQVAELNRLGRAVRRARTPEEKAESQKRFSEYLWEVEHGAEAGGEQH